MSSSYIPKPQSPAQRVANALSRQNEPVACEKCGSIFFYELNAQMYTGGNYGMRVLSSTPQKVFLCICGMPQIPTNARQGVQGGSEKDLFLQSFDLASAYIRNNSLSNVAAGTASVTELHELAERVEAIVANSTVPKGRLYSDVEEEEPEVKVAPVAPPKDASVRTGRGNGQGSDVKFVYPEDRRPPGSKGGASARMHRQGSAS